MAFPTTIFAGGGIDGHQPPCKSSAGNFYAIVPISTTAIEAYKATDPEGGSWSAVDVGANNPAGFGTLSVLSYVQAGDSIMCCTWDGTIYEYHRFNMSTDTWDVVDSDLGTIDQAPTFPWCSIAVRNDGDIICVIAGDTDQNMGGKKERVDYVESTTDGSGWGTHTALDTDVDEHFGNPNVVKGPLTDDMHIAWQTTVNTDDPPTAWTDTEARTLDSANSLSTTVSSTSDSGSILLGNASLVSYEDNGTQRIHWLLGLDETDILSLRSTEDGSDDISTITGVTALTDNPHSQAGTSAISHTEDSGNLYGVFIEALDRDIYYTTSSDDGANWSAASATFTGISALRLSCNIYQRGGNTVLAVTYSEASAIKYNEKVLSTGLSYTQLDHAELTGLVNTHVGPFEMA